jgi:hypothetical protein
MFLYQVVSRDSAVIGDAREIRDYIYADHVDMVKFSSRADSGYQKVVHAIEVLLAQSPEPELATSGEGTWMIIILAYDCSKMWPKASLKVFRRMRSVILIQLRNLTL